MPSYLSGYTCFSWVTVVEASYQNEKKCLKLLHELLLFFDPKQQTQIFI